MPFETQSNTDTTINEPEKKISKLTIILITLILIALSYLSYSLYTDSQSKDTQDNEIPALSSQELNSDELNSSSPIQDNASDTVVDNKTEQIYTLSQVAENNTKNSCWTIIEGNVYNITSYIPNHPGGESNILQVCGKDGSALFAKPTEHKEGGANNLLNGFKIGTMSQ